jgi:ATP-dependent DNA helicase PIF1
VQGATRALQKSTMGESLSLKIGAEVMCLANIDLESDCQIVNGSLGVIRGWNLDGYPRVEYRNGRILTMVPHVISSDIVDGLSIKQVPLTPAWAITTHKSQGITLDEAIIDAGSDNFEYGQIYVALSRVKTLEGLYLSSFDCCKIKANPTVTAYYDSL